MGGSCGRNVGCGWEVGCGWDVGCVQNARTHAMTDTIGFDPHGVREDPTRIRLCLGCLCVGCVGASGACMSVARAHHLHKLRSPSLHLHLAEMDTRLEIDEASREPHCRPSPVQPQMVTRK